MNPPFFMLSSTNAIRKTSLAPNQEDFGEVDRFVGKGQEIYLCRSDHEEIPCEEKSRGCL